MEIKVNYQQQTLIWISKDKNNLYVSYDSQFDLYLKCPMKYDYYPFDEHECAVKFSSADFNATRLLFNMSIDAKWGRLKNTLGQFDADIIPLEKSERMDTWEGEKWSISGFKLLLRRRHWKYVFSVPKLWIPQYHRLVKLPKLQAKSMYSLRMHILNDCSSIPNAISIVACF